MIIVRIHGGGGQGAAIASKVLAAALGSMSSPFPLWVWSGVVRLWQPSRALMVDQCVFAARSTSRTMLWCSIRA
jgi:hypothetical protein